MNKTPFSLKKRIKSFTHAIIGVKILIKEEHNSRIHLVAAVCAISLGFLLKLAAMEWLALIIGFGFVLVTELINSSIENLADFLSPEKHPLIKKVKDLSAAGVLISAIIALAIGLIIFIPKLILLF